MASKPEMPPDMPPAETQFQGPPEIVPEVPDIDEPDDSLRDAGPGSG